MGRIEWIPISELPEALKDGRQVLLWDGGADVGRWSEHADFGCGDPGWVETQEDAPLAEVTHFAEINRPERI